MSWYSSHRILGGFKFSNNFANFLISKLAVICRSCIFGIWLIRTWLKSNLNHLKIHVPAPDGRVRNILNIAMTFFRWANWRTAKMNPPMWEGQRIVPHRWFFYSVRQWTKLKLKYLEPEMINWLDRLNCKWIRMIFIIDKHLNKQVKIWLLYYVYCSC